MRGRVLSPRNTDGRFSFFGLSEPVQFINTGYGERTSVNALSLRGIIW